MSLKEEIESLGLLADDSDSKRELFSTDASIFKAKPQLVVMPKNVEDLSKLINLANKKSKEGEKISISPRAGGTCMSGGSLNDSIVLDMTENFRNIGEVDAENKLVSLQSGVYYRDLEKETKKKGLEVASYTSSKNLCGVGGMVGNNASGERSIKYGATSKQIASLKAILSDGVEYEFKPLNKEDFSEVMKEDSLFGRLHKEVFEILEEKEGLIKEKYPKVKKNAAGYALNEVWNEDKTIFNLGRLFVGAQATLGIVTEIKFKLTPTIERSTMLVVALDDLKEITDVVKIFLSEKAEIIETFDHHTYELAEEHIKEDAERASLAKGKHLVIFAVFSGETDEEMKEKVENSFEKLKAGGYAPEIVTEKEKTESFLNIRRASFKLLLDFPKPGLRAAAFLEDTIVPIEHYGDFLEKLEKILDKYDLIYTYAGHIGDGSIRLVPLIDFEKEKSQEMIMKLAKEVYDLTFSFGGSMSVDHNDGFIRTPYLENMYGKDLMNIFRKIKNAFDPQNIFNSGKKLSIDEKTAISHMIKSNR